jgi:DNA-binding GntR family transcriptional regulator
MTATDLEMTTSIGAREEPPAETSVREPGHKLKQLLRADIVAGRIPAGSRLKVSDVIARYGTSTNPAREALHALEGEGLVVITPNRGARVRSIDDDFVNCIFDIRRLIEPYIVRWFTEYATAEDRRMLEDIQVKVQEAADAEDLPTFHKNNRDFHDLIISRHFNAEAARIMRTQNGWLRLLTSEYPPTPLQMKRSSAEHWELIAAIKAFDADLAAEIIVRHGERSQASLMGRMQRRRPERQASGG